MKRLLFARRRHGKASALVIVLAFAVLIAIVMLSYLASTQSSLKKSSFSAAIVQTDLLAEAATAAIIDDIRQEMLAGSDGTSEPAADEPMSVTQPWAMEPGRVLSSSISRTDTNFFNLVKQSLSGSAFYPRGSPAAYTKKGNAAQHTGRARASAVNSSASSLNGRIISAARWNKPLLLTGDGFTAANQLPDWILISRSGHLTNGASPGAYTNRASGNAEYVIGRFAYNIYDEGGLLDINVAGFPASATNDAPLKGSLAWADLSAIPGVTDAAKVAGWRNTNTISGYLDMVQGRPPGVANVATNRPWGEPGGFLKPYNTNGLSDNRFFTRQDLIKYAMAYANAGLTTNALPYLTTFSADSDTPSFAPETVYAFEVDDRQKRLTPREQANRSTLEADGREGTKKEGNIECRYVAYLDTKTQLPLYPDVFLFGDAQRRLGSSTAIYPGASQLEKGYCI